MSGFTTTTPRFMITYTSEGSTSRRSRNTMIVIACSERGARSIFRSMTRNSMGDKRIVSVEAI